MLQRAIRRVAQRLAPRTASATSVATRWMASQEVPAAVAPTEMPMFTEPSHFPENLFVAGGGFHEDIVAGMASPETAQEIFDQLKLDLELQAQLAESEVSFDSAAAEHFQLDPHLDEMALRAFSEASTFPEFTPSEDGLFTQTHGVAPSAAEIERQAQIWEAQEAPITLAQSSLLSEMPAFSEPSDFPEVPTVEEVIALRKDLGMM